MRRHTPASSRVRAAVSFLRDRLEEARAGLGHVPAAVRSGAVAREWLRRACPAVATVATLALLASGPLPRALDAALNVVLPDVVEERQVLGVVALRTEQANPHIPAVKSGLLFLVWGGIALSGLVLALRPLPAAVTAAERAAAAAER